MSKEIRMLKMTKERLSFGTRYYIEAFFFSRRRTSLNGIVGSLRWLAIMAKSYRSSSNSSYSSIGKMTALRLPFLTTYSAADSRALSEQDYSCGEDAATNPAGATQGNHPRNILSTAPDCRLSRRRKVPGRWRISSSSNFADLAPRTELR